MHPTDEHLLPFYVAAGAGAGHAAGVLPAARRLHDSLTYGCLAMDAYAFGPAADALAGALVDRPVDGSADLAPALASTQAQPGGC
jgi:4,5-DOPA dioxygenase extradiol